MSATCTLCIKSESTGAAAEFVDRGGTHQIGGGGEWHLRGYLRYDLFETITEMGNRHQIVPIRCTYMYASSRHWYHLLFSKPLLQQYMYLWKAVEYNTDDLTSFLALLPTILAPHCYNRRGWEYTAFV